MQAISVLLSRCVGSPPITREFASQRAGDAEIWCVTCCEPQQTVEQTVVVGDSKRFDSHMTSL